MARPAEGRATERSALIDPDPPDDLGVFGVLAVLSASRNTTSTGGDCSGGGAGRAGIWNGRDRERDGARSTSTTPCAIVEISSTRPARMAMRPAGATERCPRPVCAILWSLRFALRILVIA